MYLAYKDIFGVVPRGGDVDRNIAFRVNIRSFGVVPRKGAVDRN